MNPNEPQNPTIVPDANQPIQPFQPMQPAGQNMDFVQPPPVTPAPTEQPIQMPPYAPAQPPVSADELLPDIDTPIMPTFETIAPTKQKKDGLGIVSIVFGIMGLFPLGLILGLMGASRAKKAHRSPLLSRIGWILSLIVMLVAVPLGVMQIMSNTKAAETRERDTERATDLSIIETKLEEYFSENFGYPNSLDELNISDEQVLIGPNGSTIKANDVAFDENEAKNSSDPTSKVEYTYTPYGKPVCISTCDGYVLKSLVESPTQGVSNPLVKLGLENL